MKLTNEEFAIVGKWESNILTAIRSRYLRHVGRAGIAQLVPIYERVTDRRVYINANCGGCVLDFLQRLGAIYFADKKERESAGDGTAADEPATKPRKPRQKQPSK